MLDNLLVVNRAEKNMNSSHLECREAQGEGAQRGVEWETAAQEEGGYGGEEAGRRVQFLGRIMARFSEDALYLVIPMIGQNWQLVTNELVEFEK